MSDNRKEHKCMNDYTKTGKQNVRVSQSIKDKMVATASTKNDNRRDITRKFN